MPDSIDTLPAKIVATDTLDHEVEIHPTLFDEVGNILYIDVKVGSFQFGLRPISGASGVYAAASNSKCVLTCESGRFRYKANAVSDEFVISA